MPRVEGVIRPRVVLPEGLAPEAAAMALAHETAHVRRRDPQWSLVADLVCAALWFAPGVWLCARAMRAEAEAACDAEALRASAADPRAYARLLLVYAGPAPANALGGPARRLARRILMLEKSPKPLSRPLVAGLLAVGFAALLPWRAVAAPDGPTAVQGIEGLFPFRVTMEDAMFAMLDQPGVKAKIGWTSDQEAALTARKARIASFKAAIDAEYAQIERTKSQKDAIHIRYLRQENDRAGMHDAPNPLPWTDAQAAQLKSLALGRLGSALWYDDEVSRRLHLTFQQSHSLVMQEGPLLTRAFQEDPNVRKASLPLPNPVKDQAMWIQYKIYIAVPKDRPTLQARMDALLSPYRKNVPKLTPAQRAVQSRTMLAKAWRLREASEPQRLALLTESQRRILQKLVSDPSAWRDADTRTMRLVAPQVTPAAGPLQGDARWEPAVRVDLDVAAKVMLGEPGVKAEIGWSADQDAAIKAANGRWQKAWDAFAAELYRRHRTMTLREVFAWDQRERPKALARANAAVEPFPWTPDQEHTLKSLAVARFGSGVWKDPQVANRLLLTPAQMAGVTKENAAINRAFSKMDPMPPTVRPAKPMPERVKRQLAALEAQYLDAPASTRPSINDRMAALRSRYLTGYAAASTPSQRQAERDRVLRWTWAMRADADYRLTSTLSSGQRTTLAALATNPTAWNRPLVYNAAGSGVTTQEGIHRGVGKPALRPGKAAVGRTIVNGTRYDVWRRLHPGKGPAVYDYSVTVTPPARVPSPREPAQAPSAAADKIFTPGGHLTILAKTITSSGGRASYEGDVLIEGEQADRWPDGPTPDAPLRTYRSADGSGLRIYRRPGQKYKYAYQVELFPPASKPASRTGGPFPSSVGPLDHYAPGLQPGRNGGQAPKTMATVKPAYSLWRAPLTDESVRRSLHLNDGERLDFKPASDHPGTEVATVPDKEGIVTFHRIYRHRTGEFYTYEVESVRQIKVPGRKP